jgi:clan AA aspartic protease
MGITNIEGIVQGPRGKKVTLTFLVDSGAGYSLLPEQVWKNLGLKPRREVSVGLADGTILTRSVSECRIKMAGAEGFSPVILGQPGDQAVLGAVTLENLGLVLNPYQRSLQPMRLRL